MSVPSWAVAGAAVVCVRSFENARTVYDQGYREMPVINRTYRLAWVGDYPDLGAVCCGLDGFPSDHGFDLNGFRPAISQSDDLAAHFNQHLSANRKTEVPA